MGEPATTIKEPQNSVAIAQNSLPVTNAKMSRANIIHAKTKLNLLVGLPSIQLTGCNECCLERFT